MESGLERGGAFAIYHKGELVCDLWGGLADEVIEYSWQQDTVSIFFSATKAVCAFCLMVLADRYVTLSFIFYSTNIYCLAVLLSQSDGAQAVSLDDQAQSLWCMQTCRFSLYHSWQTASIMVLVQS